MLDVASGPGTVARLAAAVVGPDGRVVASDMPDRGRAVEEMCRVARPGGVVMVSTWASERPLGLFGPMTEALREAGMAEPYPHAFDPLSYSLGAAELRKLLSGLRDLVVETVALEAVWRNAEDAAATLMGTPYGPAIRALPAETQERVRTLFARRLRQSPDGTITIQTASHIGRGVK